MTDRQPRPEALAAAAWWATQLAGDATQDAGDPSINNMLRAYADLLTSNHTADTIERFGAALAHLIDQQMDTRQYVSLGVDYGPDPILIDAATAAGIKLGRADLPIKTHMRVKPGKVDVSAGYGAPDEIIYETDR